MKVDAFFSFLPGGFRNVVNEKAALEYAFSFSISGKSTLVQVEGAMGLSGLFDPLMSSVYMGTPGGLVVYVVSLLDPGSVLRSIAFFSKAPVVVSSQEDLSRLLPVSMEISRSFEIPVILLGPRPLERSEVEVCHLASFSFERNPARWAATPRFRFELHKKLNEKLSKMREWLEGRCDGFVRFCGDGEPFISEFPRHGFKTLVVPFSHPLPVGFLKGFFEGHVGTDSFPILWQASGILDVFLEDVSHSTFSFYEGTKSSISLDTDRFHQLALKFDLVVADGSFDLVFDDVDVLRSPMGSSISIASGMMRAGKKALAVTDDLSFFHSGYPALLNSYYNKDYVKVLVLSSIPDVVERMVSSIGVRVLRGEDIFSLSPDGDFLEVGLP